MNALKESIRKAMVETKRIGGKFRVNIRSIEQRSSSNNWVTVCVDVIKPRHRKPSYYWELAIWVPDDTIRWDLSHRYDY